MQATPRLFLAYVAMTSHSTSLPAEEPAGAPPPRPPVVWNNETFTNHPAGVTHHSFESAGVGRTVGYKDEAAFAGHAPFVKELMDAEYPFTLRTPADVPHKQSGIHVRAMRW